MLSPLAKQETMTIAAIGVLLSVAALLLGAWWLIPVILLATAALLAFFRDTDRRTPTQRGVMTAPSDGRISSIHEVDHFEPFDGPATCVRIFMSVFDGHINYSPYHSEVTSVVHKDGAHLNTLKPESAEDNESNLIVLVHPTRRYPMAAVRQVAGMLARTIVCSIQEGQVLQRGQRIGLIKLGSTTELYIAHELAPQVQVRQGQKVVGGVTVLAQITPKEGAAIVARPERRDTETHQVESPSTDESTSEPERGNDADAMKPAAVEAEVEA
ncbi:MAG: phosphatidylserine decarboxylase [Phycisphaerales bacterium JB063]